jgi:hypothetical protein
VRPAGLGVVDGGDGEEAWVERLGEVGDGFHVFLGGRVGQHGVEGLGSFPLGVVHDSFAVGAGVDVGRHEAWEVAHRLFGRLDEQVDDFALAFRANGEHVDQGGEGGSGLDRRHAGQGTPVQTVPLWSPRPGWPVEPSPALVVSKPSTRTRSRTSPGGNS